MKAEWQNMAALLCFAIPPDSASGSVTAEFYEALAYNAEGLISTGLDGYVLNGTKYTDTFTYAYDALQRLSVMYYGYSGASNKYTYSYDGLSRVSVRTLIYGGLALSRYYTYAVEEGSFGESETGRVSELTHTVGSTMTEYSYTYDARGNITHIYIGGVLKYSYAYDNLNQLVRENNAVANKTYVYTYDDAGNILTKKTYAYTTGTLGSVTSTNTYTYGNSAWGDQLTAFNGTSLSYDALGNPLSYYNGTSYTFTWTKGRQLASTVKGGVTTAYTYNADGIRTGKTVGSKTVEYVLSGSKIVAEINNGVDIRYLYDPQGSPVGMILAGTTYLYEKNLQGDIIGIYNTSGTKVASYTYDAWGNVVSSSYSDYNAYTYNPFRYRGYYYDTETGFYYLQSRYYDPTTGRFISADGVMSGSGSSVIGYNLYSYCFNNPISLQDSDGNWPEWVEEAANWVEDNIIQPVEDVVEFVGKCVETVAYTCESVFDSIEIRVMLGGGMGLEAEAVEHGMAAYAIVGPTLLLDDGVFNVGDGMRMEASTSFEGITAGSEYFVLNSWRGDQYDIPDTGWQDVANETITIASATVAIGLGAHANVSFNVIEFFERMDENLSAIWG